MKKLRLIPLLLVLLVLAGCSGTGLADQSVLKNAQESKTITWGVKADTKLFGLEDVRDGKQKDFDIDMAKLITREILEKKGKLSS